MSTGARTASSPRARAYSPIRCIARGSRPAAQAGYALTEDMNGFQQEGFGRMDMTVSGGRRCSAANAYLRPAMRRAI